MSPPTSIGAYAAATVGLLLGCVLLTTAFATAGHVIRRGDRPMSKTVWPVVLRRSGPYALGLSLILILHLAARA